MFSTSLMLSNEPRSVKFYYLNETRFPCQKIGPVIANRDDCLIMKGELKVGWPPPLPHQMMGLCRGQENYDLRTKTSCCSQFQVKICFTANELQFEF